MNVMNKTNMTNITNIKNIVNLEKHPQVRPRHLSLSFASCHQLLFKHCHLLLEGFYTLSFINKHTRVTATKEQNILLSRFLVTSRYHIIQYHTHFHPLIHPSESSGVTLSGQQVPDCSAQPVGLLRRWLSYQVCSPYADNLCHNNNNNNNNEDNNR